MKLINTYLSGSNNIVWILYKNVSYAVGREPYDDYYFPIKFCTGWLSYSEILTRLSLESLDSIQLITPSLNEEYSSYVFPS